MAVNPLTGVTIQKEGVNTVTSPTIMNFTTAAAFNVQNSPAGTAKITFPADPFVPVMKYLGSIISSVYTVINFVEGASLNVTVATVGETTTVTITIPSGSSAPYAKVYFGSGEPSTLHNNGDLYFDTSTSPYGAYVQNSNTWINF